MATTVPRAGALALVLGMTMALANPSAQAGPPARIDVPATRPAPRHVRMHFDIPAQPLQAALDEHGAATGWSAFYGADSIGGVQSAAVQGWYTPDAALRLLVEAAHLSVQYTAADAFVLEPGAPDTAAAPLPRDPVYEGLLQSRMREVFCRDARIAPGNYRVAVSFHLDGEGRIERPVLLDPTGDTARDEAILQALRQVRTGLPPSRPAQPFTMLIVPKASAAGRDCERQ
ncbi:TonB C-terminal domain-containing protein [Variovorax sp. PAMC26660]|uniref:TonB C-terminal domain-containing protein n=1 Tax=Variovorax sp. PAMC26660 TaxID=2762322 RepID=UPI00164D3445|nr:TonB C-terminal domain-containing protein [Variovorax sp. PAMC26660]QNK65730.1 energy transducer TonB [Variovorax sp. PAMC26660]